MCLLKDRLLSSKKKMFLPSYKKMLPYNSPLPIFCLNSIGKNDISNSYLSLQTNIKILAKEKNPKPYTFMRQCCLGWWKELPLSFMEEMKKGNYWHGLISLSSSKKNCLWLFFWRLHPQCRGTNGGVGIWKEIRPWDVFISFWPCCKGM